MPELPLRKKAAAEFVGTAFLVTGVVGSGIMAERLAGGNTAIALLANTIATGAALVALILAFGRISGAHLNPAVTVADALEDGISWREVPAYSNLYADRGQCRAISAGTQPAAHVHDAVVEVMREIGIDLSTARPQKLTDELARSTSVLVTMGCGEACPFVPGLRTLDWPVTDPKGQSLDVVRAIRDEIHEKVKALIGAECADCAVLRNC